MIISGSNNGSTGAIFIGLAILLTSCTLEYTPEELDMVARHNGMETMVVTDEMTVWCPHGPKLTATIVDILKEEVKATSAFLVRRDEKHDPSACNEAFFRLSEVERKDLIIFKKFIFQDGLPNPTTSQ